MFITVLFYSFLIVIGLVILSAIVTELGKISSRKHGKAILTRTIGTTLSDINGIINCLSADVFGIHNENDKMIIQRLRARREAIIEASLPK